MPGNAKPSNEQKLDPMAGPATQKAINETGRNLIASLFGNLHAGSVEQNVPPVRYYS